MLELPFTPRLPPISHQARVMSESARRPYFGLFWEQGTGKTKTLIDNAALLLVLGEIDRGFVLAPNGVHRNWHVEELPKHWPADVPEYVSFSWDTTKAASKAHQAAFQDFLSHRAPMKWLCMSYDGLMTKEGKQASWDFIRKGKVFYAGDESQRIKTPDAALTKRAIASSVYAPYRRIASGTPMDTPLDIYSQMRFLDPEFWIRSCGIGSFVAFRARFGQYETRYGAGGRTYKQLIGFQYLEELQEVLATASDRVLKEDVLDLPKKTYKRVFHQLTNAQRAAYEELKAEALTILESGELVTAEMALVLDLRLTQIGCGHITPSAGAKPVPFDVNPRADIFATTLEDLTRPAIVWGRFVEDVRVCEELARKVGRRPVVYDGSHPERSMDAFHSGKADTIIANIESSMTEGYTLNEAKYVLYYSNSPKLIKRQQSEDRPHRIGQNETVTYIDFLAERTLDAKKLRDLQKKRELTGGVLGDPGATLKAWLTEESDDDV